MAQDQSLQGAKLHDVNAPPPNEPISKVLTAGAECVEDSQYTFKEVFVLPQIFQYSVPSPRSSQKHKKTSPSKTTVCDYSYLNTAHQYYCVHRAPVQESVKDMLSYYMS